MSLFRLSRSMSVVKYNSHERLPDEVVFESPPLSYNEYRLIQWVLSTDYQTFDPVVDYLCNPRSLVKIKSLKVDGVDCLVLLFKATSYSYTYPRAYYENFNEGVSYLEYLAFDNSKRFSSLIDLLYHLKSSLNPLSYFKRGLIPLSLYNSKNSLSNLLNLVYFSNDLPDIKSAFNYLVNFDIVTYLSLDYSYRITLYDAYQLILNSEDMYYGLLEAIKLLSRRFRQYGAFKYRGVFHIVSEDGVRANNIKVNKEEYTGERLKYIQSLAKHKIKNDLNIVSDFYISKVEYAGGVLSGFVSYIRDPKNSKDTVLTEGEVSFKVFVITDLNLDIGLLEIDYLDIANPSYLPLGRLYKFYKGKSLVFMKDTGVFTKISFSDKAGYYVSTISYNLNKSNTRSLNTRLNIEAVRRQLGSELTEILSRLVSGDKSFEEGLLSSPKDLAILYDKLQNTYSTLITKEKLFVAKRTNNLVTKGIESIIRDLYKDAQKAYDRELK